MNSKYIISIFVLTYCSISFSQINKIYNNAVIKINNTDSIITYFTGIHQDKLFDISYKLRKKIPIDNNTFLKDKLIKNNNSLSDSIIIESLIDTNDYLKLYYLPKSLYDTITNNHNWLVFTRPNKKLRLMTANLEINILQEEKSILKGYYSPTVIYYYFIYNHQWKLVDFFYKTGFR